MKTSRIHPTIVKLVATGATLLFLLTLSALPALAKAGTIIEFALPKANSGPQNIVSGPDGNLWFTEANVNKIGRISISGHIIQFALPKANSGPIGIVSGPDGNLWFTEFDANKIGRITTSGRITEFVVPSPKSGPFGITPGPDGKMWFTEYGFTAKTGDKIGRVAAE